MSHRLGFNGYVAPASTSSAIPSPGQSGVYNNYYSNLRAQPLPSFWRESDEEQVTRHRSPDARRETILPTQPLHARQAPLWQVALQLRGDELSRLWRRNANHLAGRIFVWSDYSGQWIQPEGVPELGPDVGPPTYTNELPREFVQGSVSPNAYSNEPVDVTRDARPQWFRPRLTRGWAVGLAASLLTVVAVAALLPSKPHASKDVQPATEQPQSAPPSVGSPALDVVPVESLPLVIANSKTAPASHATHASLPQVGATVTAGVAAAFSPAHARQALARAASQAGHCSHGDVSGSVLVTYEPSGAVGDVALSALAGDLSGAACIANAFRAARIAPFQGSRVTVRKTFSTHT